ncbi:MAG TPA: hypothetical protein VG276_00450, partial [Actinomycetes bacterium]|nr:hypothetical protein [Actinomycetes bacterium]
MAVREHQLHLAPPAVPARAASDSARRLLLWSRLLGDVGALVLGLVAAEGIQQTLVHAELLHPLGTVSMFNGLAILTWLALFASVGLYDSRRLVNAFDEFKMVLQGVALGTVGAVFLTFLLKVATYRSWVLTTWGVST